MELWKDPMSYHDDRFLAEAFLQSSSVALQSSTPDALPSSQWDKPLGLGFNVPCQGLEHDIVRESAVANTLSSIQGQENPGRQVRQRHTDEEWESHREKITQLVQQNVKLEDIMTIMADDKRPLKACRRTYQTKLRQWGLRKYTKSSKMRHILAVVEERKQTGKDTRISDENGVWPEEKIQRFSKRPFVKSGNCDAASPSSLTGLRLDTPSPPAAEDVNDSTEPNDTTLANVNKLTIQYDQDEWDAAVSVSRELLEMTRQQLPFLDDSYLIARLMLILSELMTLRCVEETETPMLIAALKGNERILGDIFIPKWLSLTNNRLAVSSKLTQLEEGVSWQQEALKIPRRLPSNSEAREEFLSHGLLALAKDLHAIGKDDEAALLKREALEKQRRICGEHHAETLETKISLAQSLHGLKKFDEAVSLKQEVLEAQRKTLGDEQSKTLCTMANLAISKTMLGSYEKATSLGLQALTGLQAIEKQQQNLTDLDLDILDRIRCTATVLGREGKSESALLLLEETLPFLKRVLGVEHRETQLSMYAYAITLIVLERNDEAEKLYREIYEKRTWGKGLLEDFITLRSVHTLLNVLVHQNKAEEAFSIAEAAHEKSRQALGGEHDITRRMEDEIRRLQALQ